MEECRELNEYERRRLENIRRNDEMMASLKIHLRANDLSSAVKNKRKEIKSYKKNSEKKPKTETPIVFRRSLRTRGIPPDSVSAKGLEDDLTPSPQKTTDSHPPSWVRKQDSFSMREALDIGDISDHQQFIDTIDAMSESAPFHSSYERKEDDNRHSYFDLSSMVLKRENIARVVPRRIFSVNFFPSEERTVIAVGSKMGHVGFWDVDCEDEGKDGIYAYCPHSAPVSAILIPPYPLSKIFTSSYDGLIRMMDVSQERFNMVYSSDEAIFSLSQRPSEMKPFYFGTGQGKLKVLDERNGKVSSSYSLHCQRINSIDFNSQNNNLMATSSSDGKACIWDLRNIKLHCEEALNVVNHKRAVHSAYFSPSGNRLATTSYDDKVGLLHGSGFKDLDMIHHSNQTSIWISTFRAIWGWDDEHLFIGNNRRAVDVISATQGRTSSLTSDLITAIPCRFAAHPSRAGVLAGTTAGGQVYIWTPK